MLELILDVIFFISIALILGFILDLVIPDFTLGEHPWKSLFFLFLQGCICVMIIYVIDLAFVRVVGRSSTTYFGLNIFFILFFLCQVQFFHRVSNLFANVTHRRLIPRDAYVMTR